MPHGPSPPDQAPPVRQIYPVAAQPGPAALAALYAYPGPSPTRPWWLRANMVSSLDGAATVGGRSGGLSGEADRQVFALLRSLADVILVGAGTARAEDYGPVRPGTEGVAWSWLRARRPPSPAIAVVTGSLHLPAGLLAAPGHARTIVITTGAAPARARRALAGRADVIVAGDDQVDLRAAIGALAARGHRRILTEGGPHLLAQIAAAGLLDELCLTFSPVLAGPGAGRVVGGAPGAAGPRPAEFALAHVLTDGGHLLCRYVRPDDPRPHPGGRRISPRSKLTGSSS